jgi:RNA polymerase sigma factor (sigma-70 family)
MATTSLDRVLDRLRLALAPADGVAPTDGQLLARFAAARDQDAFAALVARHGALVLGVCRRVLGHEQDAEDAFQATFLVLARKAGSIGWADTAGPWLYEVANRTALEARAVVRRRRARETQVEVIPQPAVPEGEPLDWRPLLDQELCRLPKKYRGAVVLCELQGRTRREAAAELGIPEGTLSSRLATARRLLAQRLARRGLALPAAGLAALGGSTASAAVPITLAGSTIKSAVLVAVGLAGEAPAAVLMKGVLRAMFLTKLKLAAGLVMVATALGAGGFAYQAGRPAQAQADSPGARPKDDLEALKRENELLRLNVQLILEKVRAQEAELRALKDQKTTVQSWNSASMRGAFSAPPWDRADPNWFRDARAEWARRAAGPIPDPVKQAEAALKAYQSARDREGRRRAADALEKATKRLREQLKDPPAAPRK